MSQHEGESSEHGSSLVIVDYNGTDDDGSFQEYKASANSADHLPSESVESNEGDEGDHNGGDLILPMSKELLVTSWLNEGKIICDHTPTTRQQSLGRSHSESETSVNGRLSAVAASSIPAILEEQVKQMESSKDSNGSENPEGEESVDGAETGKDGESNGETGEFSHDEQAEHHSTDESMREGAVGGGQLLLDSFGDPLDRAWAEAKGLAQKMEALYTYDSKNYRNFDGAEMDLSFHKGDVITVFGAMDGDGFYVGELNGCLGLVPSNFIQPIDTSSSPHPTGLQLYDDASCKAADASGATDEDDKKSSSEQELQLSSNGGEKEVEHNETAGEGEAQPQPTRSDAAGGASANMVAGWRFHTFPRDLLIVALLAIIIFLQALAIYSQHYHHHSQMDALLQQRNDAVAGLEYKLKTKELELGNEKLRAEMCELRLSDLLLGENCDFEDPTQLEVNSKTAQQEEQQELTQKPREPQAAQAKARSAPTGIIFESPHSDNETHFTTGWRITAITILLGVSLYALHIARKFIRRKEAETKKVQLAILFVIMGVTIELALSAITSDWTVRAAIGIVAAVMCACTERIFWDILVRFTFGVALIVTVQTPLVVFVFSLPVRVLFVGAFFASLAIPAKY